MQCNSNNSSSATKLEKSNSFVIKRDRVDQERKEILDRINRNLKLAENLKFENFGPDFSEKWFRERTPKVVEHGSLRQKTNFKNGRNSGVFGKSGAKLVVQDGDKD